MLECVLYFGVRICLHDTVDPNLRNYAFDNTITQTTQHHRSAQDIRQTQLEIRMPP